MTTTMTTTTASLWRVVITEKQPRKRAWQHVYAVVAQDEATATAKALEAFRAWPDADLTVTAEADTSGVIKCHELRG